MNHEVTVERCEHKKFRNDTLLKTVYKLSSYIDLDDFTAVENSNGRLEMSAPYGRKFKKPTRQLEIVPANESYSASTILNDATGKIKKYHINHSIIINLKNNFL